MLDNSNADATVATIVEPLAADRAGGQSVVIVARRSKQPNFDVFVTQCGERHAAEEPNDSVRTKEGVSQSQ